MIKYCKPPKKINFSQHKENGYKLIFLAGSIDMGKSKPWADDLFNKLVKEKSSNKILLMNPRRDDWDSSWEQSIENKEFKGQVTWELDGLDASDIIVINILPDSKSPITLLEMGLHIKDKEIMLCCPDGFYRKGNVDIVAERHNVKVYKDFDELIEDLKEKIL